VKERRQEALEHPDIEFTAGVRAREMRFDEVPETEVWFWGLPERTSVSEMERKNLPDEVQRDMTYRNFSVQLRIATELIETEPGSQEAERSRGTRRHEPPEERNSRAKAPEEGGRSG